MSSSISQLRAECLSNEKTGVSSSASQLYAETNSDVNGNSNSDDSDGCFKVLIENHGMCPLHLEATSVVGPLLSVTEVTSEDSPELWKQFKSVSDDSVNVTLCDVPPRDEALLQTEPVNWQSLSEGETTQLQSLIVEYADVFAMELGRTDLVQHVIDTDDHKPIKQPPRRIPFLLIDF